MNLTNAGNFDLFSVGIAIAGIGILGFAVFLSTHADELRASGRNMHGR